MSGFMMGDPQIFTDFYKTSVGVSFFLLTQKPDIDHMFGFICFNNITFQLLFS